ADSGNLDKDKSALEAAPLTIVANDTTTSALKLTLKDANGNPVSGQTVLFSTTLANTTFGTVKDNQDGTYTATLKGKTAGAAEIKVTVGGNALEVTPVTVTLTADSSNLDKDKSALAATPLSIVADGNTTSALTLTLKDVNGNAVSGQTVLFSTALGGTTFSAVTDNQDGTYTATLKGTKAGEALLTVAVNGVELDVAAVTITLSAGIPDVNNSNLQIDKQRVIANDGKSEGTAIITLLIDDANGNGVNDLEDRIKFVVLSNNSPVTEGVTINDVTPTNNIGEYVATVSGTKTGNYEIHVQLDGNDFGNLKAAVTLYSFLFKLNFDYSSTKVPTVIEGGTLKFIVTATTTDTNEDIDISKFVNWAVKDTNVATIDEVGEITGISNGRTEVSADGTYKDIIIEKLISPLRVNGSMESPWYGSTIGATTKTSIVGYPSYSLSARGAAVIDSIGSSESFVGGTGGYPVEIAPTDKVRKIKIYYGVFTNTNQVTVNRLEFTMEDSSVIAVGWAVPHSYIKNQQEQTYDIPDDYILQGVVANGGGFINGVKFIVGPKPSS
ncbi:TPA: Ig-like domain-containing protein, partial [Morganella morganii]|nr:Ig-like domain-containing protein [Morganella morganii]